WFHGADLAAALLFEYGPGPVYPILSDAARSDEKLVRQILDHARTRLRDENGSVSVRIKNTDRLMQLAARELGYVPTPKRENEGILEIASADLDLRLEKGF